MEGRRRSDSWLGTASAWLAQLPPVISPAGAGCKISSNRGASGVVESNESPGKPSATSTVSMRQVWRRCARQTQDVAGGRSPLGSLVQAQNSIW